MKFDSMHYRGDWKIRDISKEQNTFGWLTLNTYSDVLDEEVEIASVIANDIDVDEMISTFSVISKANDMFELLEECYDVFKKTNNVEMKSKVEKLLNEIIDQEIEIDM